MSVIFIKIFSYVLNYVNFAIDSIQHDKFVEQQRSSAEQRHELLHHEYHRQSPWHYAHDHDTGDEDHDPVDEDHKHRSKPHKPASPYNLFGSVRLLLEYNRNGFLQLVILVFHMSWFINEIVKLTIFGIYDYQRDPNTSEYEQPFLRSLEDYYFFNHMLYFERSRNFQHVIATIVFQLFLLRLRVLYDRCSFARTNQFRYVKLDTTISDGAYLMLICRTLQNSWFRHATLFFGHRCDDKSAAAIEHSVHMKRLTRMLRTRNRVERFYFFNQIDFTPCFKQYGVLDNYHAKLRLEQKKKVQGQRRKEVSSYEWLTSVNLPNRRPFIAGPVNKIDPAELGDLMLALMFAGYLIGSFIVLATAFATAINMRQSGLIYSNLMETFWPAITTFFSRRKHIVITCEIILLFLMLSVNFLDYGLVLYSSKMFQSRCRRVIHLLINLQQFNHCHMKGFFIYAGRCGVNLRELVLIDYLTPEPIWIHDSPVEPTIENPAEFDANEDPAMPTMDMVRSDGLYDWSFKPVRHRARAQNVSDVNPSDVDQGSESGSFESLVSHYKKEQISQESLLEFNSSLDYVLSLIEVLQVEIADQKRRYTFLINITISFSGLGIVMASALFNKLTQSAEIFLVMIIMFIQLLSMVLALYLGAFAERSFRQIYREMTPLTINQLRLTSLLNLKRMRNICNFIACLENRSFIILSELPLTFGSMTSIIGWILTGNLFLQRFF